MKHRHILVFASALLLNALPSSASQEFALDLGPHGVKQVKRSPVANLVGKWNGAYTNSKSEVHNMSVIVEKQRGPEMKGRLTLTELHCGGTFPFTGYVGDANRVEFTALDNGSNCGTRVYTGRVTGDTIVLNSSAGIPVSLKR